MLKKTIKDAGRYTQREVEVEPLSIVDAKMRKMIEQDRHNSVPKTETEPQQRSNWNLQSHTVAEMAS